MSTRGRFFYHGAPDPLTGYSPRLFVVDLNTEFAAVPEEVFADKPLAIAALLGEGAREISYRTAYALGWPV